jgi:hypothetical protein
VNSWKPKFLRTYKGNQKCNAFSKQNEEGLDLSKDKLHQNPSFEKNEVNNQNNSVCNDPKASDIKLFNPTSEEQKGLKINEVKFIKDPMKPV